MFTEECFIFVRLLQCALKTWTCSVRREFLRQKRRELYSRAPSNLDTSWISTLRSSRASTVSRYYTYTCRTWEEWSKLTSFISHMGCQTVIVYMFCNSDVFMLFVRWVALWARGRCLIWSEFLMKASKRWRQVERRRSFCPQQLTCSV